MDICFWFGVSTPFIVALFSISLISIFSWFEVGSDLILGILFVIELKKGFRFAPHSGHAGYVRGGFIDRSFSSIGFWKTFLHS